MPVRLEDDKWCYVCGKENPAGLKLDFEHPQAGVMRAKVVFKKEHQGYKGIVHGGFVATVLDEMMVNLAWKEGQPVVTAEMTFRLHKPTPVGEPILFEGKNGPAQKKLIPATAEARDRKGTLLASAEAKLIRLQSALDKSAPAELH